MANSKKRYFNYFSRASISSTLATLMILEVSARKAFTYFPCTFFELTPLEAVQRVLDVLLGPTVSTKNGFFSL